MRQHSSLHRTSGETVNVPLTFLPRFKTPCWSYYGRTIPGMSSVVKRSVSLPSELFEALEHQATAEGRTVSAALTDAADLWLSTRRGLKAVRAWERQHGALTASELAEADEILDAAGVGRS